MGILCGGSMVVCGGMVYWVYDFFFLAVGLLVVVVCSAAVVEWGCCGFLFCLEFFVVGIVADLWVGDGGCF